MTNINKKDTRKLLIESAEFVSKIELSNELKEAVKLANSKSGTLIVKNIPCTILNRVNQNGRIYSTDVVNSALIEAKNAFAAKQLLSQADEHPEGSFVAPSHASHVVINSYIKKNVNIVVEGNEEQHDVLFMDWEILNTQEGKNLRALFEAECSIGTSIRGVGDMNGKYVENYELLGCDCVGNPSSSTFTRMPVSESVQLEILDPRDLKETFTITTSSTNVVKDLDSASTLQAQLDNIGYGTVTKTSTKVDEETDPKTGAMTSITTLEAETSDDVADLDQALTMARNAMLNGVVNVDSITIENIKEEQPQEATENEGTEKALNEDEYVPESKETEYDVHEITPNGVDLLHNSIVSLMHNEGLSLEQACRKYCEYHENVPYEYVLEYMRTNPVAESTINEEILKATLSYAYGIDGWYVAKLGGSLANLQYIDKQLNKLIKTGHVLVTDKDKPYIDFDHMNENEMSWLLKCLQDKLRVRLDVYNPTADVQNESIGEATITEAKDEEDPNAGKKFVLKCPAGFVAMDGNALVFKENPKEALHFIVGKEESGLVHLSGVEKILDTMGVYDVEKYYRKDTTDISASETPIEQPVEKESIPVAEDNGSATRFVAQLTIGNESGMPETSTIPVSGVELDSVVNEVSNLWKQKAENEKGQVSITVTDTSTNEQYAYNPGNNSLDPMNGLPQQEATGDIEQKDETLSLEFDNGVEVEKQFDNEAQATVAKAGLEQGKLPGDLMLSEEDKPEELTTCEWCGKKVPTNQIRNEKDLGKICFACRQSLNQRGHKLAYNEANPEYEDIQPGWYAAAQGIGVTGPFASEQEAWSGLEDVKDFVSVEYISPEMLAAESADMNEVLYTRASDASDPEVEQPLKDASEDDEFERTDTCAWCGEEFPLSDLRTEKDLGKICHHCARGLESREGPLEYTDTIYEADEEVNVVLSNIDWDVDSISNSFMANSQPDDVATVGDLESLIRDLPDTLNVKLTSKDLESDDIEAVKQLIFDKAGEQSGLVIKNAVISSVE